MGHGHAHPHEHGLDVSRKLTIATAANVVIVVAELTIGFWADSLALIGDALHNLTDAVALLLALVAVRLARRPATVAMSFGYQRAGVLAAFINGALLLAFTAWIFLEAIDRLGQPHAVQTTAMLITATIAVTINSATAFSLHREGRNDVNIRGAVIHMVSDALSSAGIIVAVILIRVTGSTIWDAVVSMLIGVLILWSAWAILRETVNLLLEGTPRGIDPAAVTRAIESVEGVLGVHHLHIWALGPSNASLSAHLMVDNVPVKTTARLLEEINATLARDHHIAHTTIQFEYANCSEDDPYCVPYSEKVTARGTRRDT